MTILASDIFRRVLIVLQDVDAVRWPYPELREWLNDGLLELALIKPSATSKTVALTLVEGTLQTVPDGYSTLIRLTRNLKTSTVPYRGTSTITAASREILDAQLSGWHDDEVVPYQQAVVHVLADPADPKSFYVYPGNDASGIVEAILSSIPTQLPAPDSPEAVDVPRFDDDGNIIAEPSIDPTDIAAYQMAVDISDIYRNPLVDFVCYRAMSKDMQLSGASQRAGAHYQQFQSALGVKQQGELTANINTTHQIPAA